MKTPEMAKTPGLSGPPAEMAAFIQRIPASGWRAVYENGTIRPVVVWQFEGSHGIGIVADGDRLRPANEIAGFKRYVYRGER